MRHDEFTHLDAAYVLGALGQDERRSYERHLESCATCSQAVRELAGMPALLAHVDQSVLTAGAEQPPVPGTLLPGLLRAVRRQRRRRLWWAVAGAAAAAVLAVTGAVAWTQADRPAGEGDVVAAPAARAEPMRPLGQDLVTGWLAMREVPWGTKLELTCTYDARPGGYATPAPVYSLAVQTRDGTWQQVATWRALPGRTMTVTAATAATRDDIAAVEVRTASGRPVLELGS